MDKDNSQASESQVADKAREGLSRRRLLKAGAAGAAVVPVMVTIKSASAQATGLAATPAHLSGGSNWSWNWNWDGHDSTKTKVYGSVACIQHLEMPPSKEHAIRNICDRHSIKYYDHDSSGGIHHSGYFRSDTPDCTDFRNYFRTTDFGPYCTFFDPSREQHCTYMEIMLSTACLNSIRTQVGWAGGKKWSGCGNNWYNRY